MVAGQEEHRRLRVLIVDDEPDIGRVLTRIVRAAGPYEPDVRTARFDVAREIAERRPDVVFLDLVMPDVSGFDLLKEIRAADGEIPVIVITAHSSIENAVEAIRLGAFDFLPKPFDPDVIELLLVKLERELSLIARTRAARFSDPLLAAIRGDSPAVRSVRDWIAKIRPAKANVLIQGESGTGKELVARAVHGGEGPFVALNMAAIPDDLAEAELFGHRQGAFTGASQERQGLLLEANGGTLFLDEVNAMSPLIQAKLLRVIQERRLRPVGSNRELAVDFRLVSAANVDLEEAVRQGTFRRDLFHRLKVLSVTLPPLRERASDIPILVAEFVQRYAQAHGCGARRLAPGVMEWLKARPWPGNIRELENLIEEAVILCPDGATEIPLPPGVAGPQPLAAAAAPGAADTPPTLADVERRYIAQVLGQTQGNKAKAARILAIDYKTLLRKLTEIG